MKFRVQLLSDSVCECDVSCMAVILFKITRLIYDDSFNPIQRLMLNVLERFLFINYVILIIFFFTITQQS